MSKRMISILLLFVFVAVMALSLFMNKRDYTERLVKVFTNGEESGELSLRFYEGTPNIPYMGMNEYAQFIGRQPFSVQQSGDGVCELENWNGARLVCDTNEDRIFAQDWNAFLALPMPIEDQAMGLKDMSAHFSRIVDITYEGEAIPVTFDFARYGIRLYSDESDIYLPVSTLSNMMTDIATNYILYNGENLYAQALSLDSSPIDGLYESDVLLAQAAGKDRPADIIHQCYADLCFNFDYFFGHPGKAVLDKAMAEKGLDQALEGLGEDGLSIKEGLLSSSFADYVDAMTKLFFRYLSDGHTLFTSGAMLATSLPAGTADSFIERSLSSYDEGMINDPVARQLILNNHIPIQRESQWGEDTYREYGSTAIIRLDSFLPDLAAWDSYYNDNGEFPQDCLGIVATGLKTASQNPKIENIIFDLSCNSGGSSDVLMAILALTTGQDKLYGRSNITGQPMIVSFESDANFDGVYDEKDKEARYDYNYGVLVSQYAFSCGNLFPIVLQQDGAVLIGEPSSGGSCSIQIGSDIEGLDYQMSSGQWQFVDSSGVLVEGGCSIDVPIETGTMSIAELAGDPTADMLSSMLGEDLDIPVYKDYFDDERLNKIMNDWFKEELDQAS